MIIKIENSYDNKLKQYPIQEIIESLHIIGARLTATENKFTIFIKKVLNRDFLESYLRYDVKELNMLNYYCYDMTMDRYCKATPMGMIHHEFSNKTFNEDFVHFILSLIYKNCCTIHCEELIKNEIKQVITKFQQEMNLPKNQCIKINYIKSKHRTTNLKYAVLIETTLLDDKEKRRIKEQLLSCPDIMVFIIGDNFLEERPSLFIEDNIKNLLKNHNKKLQGLNSIGYIISTSNKYWIIEKMDHVHFVDLMTNPIEMIYTDKPEPYRHMQILMSNDRSDDEFEYFDDDHRKKITLSRIRRIFNIAKEKSNFYREHLQSHRLDNFEDLHDIPLLTSKQLIQHIAPTGTGILTAKNPNNCFIFNSGGTTGAPKTSFRTHYDQRSVGFRHGKGLMLTGFDSNDIAANLFAAGNLWAGFQTVNGALERVGCQIVPLAAGLNTEELIILFRKFEVNAVLGMLSKVLAIAKYIENKNITDLKIKKILVAGEKATDTVKKYIRDIFKLDVLSTAAYSALDVGAIGYQCAQCHSDEYHINEDQVYIEVVDPGTKKIMGFDQIGELIATHLDRILMPIIRYSFGDMGQILSQPCPCGRKTKRLQLFGRSDDTMLIGGFKLDLLSIEKAIKRTPGLSITFQLIAEEIDRLDRLTIITESKQLQLTDNEKVNLQNKLLENLYSFFPILKNLVKSGGIHKPRIEIVPLNSIQGNIRTGKIKKTIDKRIKSR